MNSLVAPVSPWICNRAFDTLFIAGTASLALLAGLVAVLLPLLFPFILLANLLFLGAHHVIATHTRLVFDKTSMQEHGFLVIYLPFIVLACVIAAAHAFGAWILATAYLYWQWFHYTRQNYGIARLYLKKSGQMEKSSTMLDKWAFYLLPITGILYRSYQQPDTFLGMDLYILPIPLELVLTTGIAAGITILAQLVYWFRTMCNENVPTLYFTFLLSHYVLFGAGYFIVPNIDYGWLVLNVWHNTQYIAFVWLFNHNRYKDGIDSQHRFISYLSQKGNTFIYLLACVVISIVFYSLMRSLAIITSLVTTLPTAAILYMTINFHHYIVDGVIWKLRRGYKYKPTAPPLASP